MPETKARPFLKWAGGKSQLLSQFQKHYPDSLASGSVKKYIEPFIGGGAVFFDVAQRFPIRSAYLCDVNTELILTYKVIQKDVESLIDFLRCYSNKYMPMNTEDREVFFYEVRHQYNLERKKIKHNKYSADWIVRAAQMIFLNKTCYNGLFRLNRSGEFNVPFGRYKNPLILDEDNLRLSAKLLDIAEIEAVDFHEATRQATDDTFVYFDPPYRPISKTASFTSYSTFNFDDNQQIRLAMLYRQLDTQGVKVMLSNSDPKNTNPHDNFFDKMYEGFNIYRVMATRMINSVAEKRGSIYELLVLNY